MQAAYMACAYFAGLVLDILVLSAILRHGKGRFPLLMAYVIADFLTSVSEIKPVIAISRHATTEVKDSWASIYYWNERIIQLLVFLLVISLVYKATAHLGARRTLLTAIITGTLVLAAVSFAVHFDPTKLTGFWMTPWTRDLNFGASLLDLGLWAVLLSSREKDYRLLMVAGGLGIQFTGGAIGQAVRDMTNLSLLATDLTYLTNLACLYIWWQAFRHPQRSTPPREERPPMVQSSIPNAAHK
jgi:hypothetical protein